MYLVDLILSTHHSIQQYYNHASGMKEENNLAQNNVGEQWVKKGNGMNDRHHN